MDGLRTEVWGQPKPSNDPRNNQHNPQYANYWAPLTRKRHIPPHSAQPQHTSHWAPRTRKRHQQEHRPQRPTERSDPTQHAKGRTGDCPGPRKGATTGRNVTHGGGVVGVQTRGGAPPPVVGPFLVHFWAPDPPPPATPPSNSGLGTTPLRPTAPTPPPHHGTESHGQGALRCCRQVKTIGDAFMIVSDSPERLLRLSLDLQTRFQRMDWKTRDFDVLYECELEDNEEAPEPCAGALFNGLRVRCGLHYGRCDIKYDPVTKGYDYYGPPVNTAARIESVCHGGQVGAAAGPRGA